MTTHTDVSSTADGTVGKALQVMDMVADMGHPVRFGELLEKSVHPKATLYRLLQTLTNQGMLSYDEERQTYSIGLRVLRLAHVAWKQSSLAPIARPHVQALAQEVGEAVHLAQFDNGQVVFVDKMRTTDVFETLAQVGMVAPAYCTGVGKAMLAFMAPARLDIALRQQSYFPFTPTTLLSADAVRAELKQIREDRVAFDKEEHQEGIISIASPVLSDQGRIVGALSIATSTNRHDLTSITAFKDALQAAANKIGAEAAPWQFPG